MKIEEYLKSIAIYFNKERHIIIAPETITSDFSSVIESGEWYELNPPYNDEELIKIVKFALSQSFVEFSTWKHGERVVTPIQKCLKKRSYKQAIIGYGLFEIDDSKENGYEFTVTYQDAKRPGFIYMPDKTFSIPHDCTDSDFASGIRKAMELSVIEPCLSKPM